LGSIIDSLIAMGYSSEQVLHSVRHLTVDRLNVTSVYEKAAHEAKENYLKPYGTVIANGQKIGFDDGFIDLCLKMDTNEDSFVSTKEILYYFD